MWTRWRTAGSRGGRERASDVELVWELVRGFLAPGGRAGAGGTGLAALDGALSVVEPGAHGGLSPAVGERGGVTQVE